MRCTIILKGHNVSSIPSYKWIKKDKKKIRCHTSYFLVTSYFGAGPTGVLYRVTECLP